MGQLVMDTYWEQALHSNSTFLLNVAISDMERVAITSVPYQIHHDHHGPHEESHVAPPEAPPEAPPQSSH